MKISQFMLLFLLVSALFISGNGCGDYDSDDLSCPTPTVIPPQNSESYYTVLADENLTEEHKVAILQSLNEWAIKTAHTLTYKLSFIDMSKEVADVSTPHTIKVYVRDPGPGYLGWTSWSAGNHSAFTFVRPSIDGDLFRRVMLHELGHAFDLSFDGKIHYEGPYESIMYSSIGSSPGLCCPELQSFCNKYGCQIDCTNTKTSIGTTSVVPWRETPGY